MFKRVMETVVGGAIDLGALYLVAKIAYSAGKEAGEAEHDNTIQNGTKTQQKEAQEEPVKVGKIGMFVGLRRFMKKGRETPLNKVVDSLMEDPEGHKLEAFVQDGEVHVTVRRKK